jgi:toxin ParE1/3/4
MKVVLAQTAIADLIEIGRYIKKDNPLRAETFVEELEQKCRELGTMPHAFPLVPHRKNRNIRRRVHDDYLIFYRVGAIQVEVLHIVHGAQDYEAWLFDEG